MDLLRFAKHRILDPHSEIYCAARPPAPSSPCSSCSPSPCGAAGCSAGASDSTTGEGAASDGSNGDDLARRLLDARRSSTTRSSRPSRRPTAGKGVGVQDVLRRLGRPEPRGRGRPARRRRRLLAASRTSTRLVDAGHGRAGLGRRRRTKGLVTTSVVVLHRPQGQPEEHPARGTTSLKPGVEVLTPNPFTSGAAKWNLLAAYGRSVGRRQGPARRASRTSRSSSRTTSRSRTSPPARRCRTSSPATATSCSPTSTRRSTAQKKGEDVDFVIAGRHDPDRDPDRRHRRRPRTPTPAKAFQRLRALRAGAGSSSPSWGYRPVERRRCCRRTRDKFPEPRGPLHHRRPRRLGEGQRRRSSTPRTARSRRSRKTRECPRRSEHVRRHRRRTSCPPPPATTARRGARAPRRSRPGRSRSAS